MLMKRQFNKPEGWVGKYNIRQPNGQLLVPGLSEGDCLNPPPLSHIEVKHTGTNPEQNFSEDMVVRGMREGWIQFDGRSLILKAKPEDLKYAVQRSPGYYCGVCGVYLPADPDDRGERMREHIKADHMNKGTYERIHTYECVLNSEQHVKFKVKPGTYGTAQTLKHVRTTIKGGK